MQLDVVEMRKQVYRSKVLRRVARPDLLRWSRAAMPTLTDVSLLWAVVKDAGADPVVLLTKISGETMLEASQGNWEEVMAVLGELGANSVEASAAAFRCHVEPSMAGVATREKAWAHWRTVLTWATARKCLDRILPMSVEVFQGLTFDLLSVLASPATIQGVWDAVVCQHRKHHQVSPVMAAGGYNRLAKCLARFAGKQRQMKYPVHRDMVVALLQANPRTLVELRNGLATVVATMACLRPSEGAALQVCDLWFDFDARAGGRFLTGTTALNIMKRKNDQQRKGHHPRLGRSEDPALDVVHQLKVYLDAAGLGLGYQCRKRQTPHARCSVCPPLFPRARRVVGGGWALSNIASSASGFSEMIPLALKQIGMDASGFSGVCARRGGLTTAIEAHVPEHVLWMQSGHAQTRAARQYVVLSSMNPELLFQTFEAFRL